MDSYNSYCTKEQTEKAMKLGAPIEEFCGLCPTTSIDGIIYDIPTSEQMINWLAEQEVLLCINPINHSNFFWMRGVKVGEKYRWENHFEINKCKASFNTRQEATLDAISSALNYLINQKTNSNKD